MGLITYNQISGEILDSAIDVYRNLGPGSLESVYEVCLEKELIKKGLKVRRQVALPVYYKGEQLDAEYRIDLLINNIIIIELKTVEKLLPLHNAQLLSYLRL